MKKLRVFHSLLMLAVFAMLSVFMSGCFYHSGYGYGTPVYGGGYYRPMPRVYAAPMIPRYSHPHSYGYGRGRSRRW